MFLRAIISLVFVWMFFRILDRIFGLVSRRAGDGPFSPPGKQGAGHRSTRPRQRSERSKALKILALEASANDDEVRAAYLNLASKYHPDRVTHLGSELVELTAEKFKEVQEAYEQLTGAGRR